MADSIVSDLLDLMPDTISCQPVTLDGYGGFTPSGSALNLSCKISGRTRLVRNQSGQEVTSNLQAFVGSTETLTVSGHRYTLPARFSPREDLLAIAVKPVSDENGAHHSVVFFP